MPYAVIDRTAVFIGGTNYDFPQTTVQLLEGKNTVYVNQAGIQASPGSVLRDANNVPLWQLTVMNGKLQGSVDLRAQGGIGNTNLKSAPSGSAFTIGSPAIVIT